MDVNCTSEVDRGRETRVSDVAVTKIRKDGIDEEKNISRLETCLRAVNSATLSDQLCSPTQNFCHDISEQNNSREETRVSVESVQQGNERCLSVSQEGSSSGDSKDFFQMQKSCSQYAFSEDECNSDSCEKRKKSFEMHAGTSEDKKYVSQAVTFFVRHSQRGVVALCASLASLLKEQDLLRRELRKLQKGLQKVKGSHDQPLSFRLALSDSLTASPFLCSSRSRSFAEDHISSSEGEKVGEKRKNHCEMGTKKVIEGCSCKKCGSNNFNSTIVIPPVKCGQKVIIQGEIMGTVRYVGHVDEFSDNCVYVGIHLDVPIGNSDGSIEKKTYFSCKKKYGHFALMKHVVCIIPN